MTRPGLSSGNSNRFGYHHLAFSVCLGKDLGIRNTGYGIPCVWRDNGQIGGNQENFGLINRRSVSIYPQSQTVYQGLMDGLISQ